MQRDSNEMTREELEDWWTERGVTRWGEEERQGLRRQARAKQVETLRADYDAAHLSAQEMMDRAKERDKGNVVQHQAQHCNDDGPT